MTTLRITGECVDLVKHFEGFASEPYFCPAGVRTIGYGHVIIPGEQFTRITEDQAGDLLVNDLARYGVYVKHHVHVPLNDNQFSALSSLTFNVGTGPLFGSLGERLNASDYGGCAAEFDRWVYSKAKKLTGLVARRAAEKALFLKPVT